MCRGDPDGTQAADTRASSALLGHGWKCQNHTGLAIRELSDPLSPLLVSQEREVALKED